jgi:hypothetical protein
VLINVFTVDPADVDALPAAWEDDANWMKREPGYIFTQLHRGIGGSCVLRPAGLCGYWSTLRALVLASRAVRRGLNTDAFRGPLLLRRAASLARPATAGPARHAVGKGFVRRAS